MGGPFRSLLLALSLVHTNRSGPLQLRWSVWRWRWKRMAVICDWSRWKSLMWEPLAHSLVGSMGAHTGCAAWTNKALCVLEWIPLLPWSMDPALLPVWSAVFWRWHQWQTEHSGFLFRDGNCFFELQQLLHSFLMDVDTRISVQHNP